LFQYYEDDGTIRDVGSGDVNDYIREIAGEEFTAKDFRTWAGTVLAACALCEQQRFKSGAEARRNLKKAVESVAERLGNTVAVCRKCYIHPAVFDAYLQESLSVKSASPGRLRPEEAAVLTLLKRASKSKVTMTLEESLEKSLREIVKKKK
jgi:DNA topoisomerase I